VRARLARLRAQLDRSLFIDSPPPDRRLAAWQWAALIGSLLAIGVVLQLLRIGWSVSLDSLWAEDGPIFLQASLFQGFADAVFTPYAGYLVVVPRLIGEGANLLPLQDAAAAISVLSAIVVALCGLAVWFAAAGHIRNPYLRGTLVALTVLAPVASLESIDSAAYVAWYMLFATFWLLLWRPRTTWGAALGALFVLATALSSPGVWFFLPVAVLRALAVRDRRDLAIVGAYFLGGAIQIPVLAANQGDTVEPSWSSEIWAAYVQRILDGAAFGQELGGVLWAYLGAPFLVLLCLAALGALVALLRRSGPAGRWLAAVAIPTSLLLFVVSVYQRAVGDQMGWGAGTFNGAGGRYTIVPALLLVSAALALIEDSPWRRRLRGGLSLAGAMAAAAMLVSLIGSFDQRDEATRGTPRWGTALRDATAACTDEKLYEVSVPTSPPSFGMQVPCARLDDE
jgi:hypothetical protein